MGNTQQAPQGAPVPQGAPAQMPEGQWAISNEDRKTIRDFGRKLTEFLINYGKENNGLESKTIAGGFEYAMSIQSQRARLISDNFSLAVKVVAENGLGEKINEPFEDVPVKPVQKASVAPSAGKDVPGPIETPAETPAEKPATDGPEAPVAPVGVKPEAPAETPAEAPTETPEVETPVEGKPQTEEAPLPPTA